MTLTMVKEEVMDLKPSVLKLEHELILDDHEETGNAGVSMGSKILWPTKNQRRRQDLNKSTNQKKAPQKKLGLFPIVILERLDLSSLKSLQSKIKTSASSDKSGPEKSLRIKEEPVDIADLHADFVMNSRRKISIGTSSYSICDDHSKSSLDVVEKKLKNLLTMESSATQPIIEAENEIDVSINENIDSSYQNQFGSSDALASKTLKSSLKEGELVIHNLEGTLIKSEIPVIERSIKIPSGSVLKNGYYRCDLCGRQLKNIANLKGHFRNIHSDERPFSCKLCPKRFKTKSILKNHLFVTHSDVRPYKCTLCEASFKTKNSVAFHLSSGVHSDERPHACELCPLRFAARSNLLSHIKTHSLERPYSCKVCARGFRLEKFLQHHLKTHSDERPFACRICSLRFRCKASLRNHFQRLHAHQMTDTFNESFNSCKKRDSKKNLSCRGSGRNLIPLTYSSQHKNKRQFKSTLKTLSANELYTCEICSAKFKDKKGLLLHLQSHANKRLFGCVHCNAKFVRRSVLITHLTSHSDERPYSCHKCSKRFKGKGPLSTHLKSHSNKRLFKCDICDARLKSKSSLNYHRSTHSVEKPFSCNQCSACFRGESGLKSHVQNYHTDRSVMSCKYCSEKFSQKFCLQSHVQKMHKKERPFSCGECSFRAESEHDLNSHLQVHSDERPFACKLCSQQFKRRWILKMHLLNIHHKKSLPS